MGSNVIRVGFAGVPFGMAIKMAMMKGVFSVKYTKI